MHSSQKEQYSKQGQHAERGSRVTVRKQRCRMQRSSLFGMLQAVSMVAYFSRAGTPAAGLAAKPDAIAELPQNIANKVSM
jgi:hypothetical protein